MSPNSTIEVLNRLAILHTRSLPKYLSYAQPWSPDDEAARTLDQIVAAQDAMADRVQQMVLERRGEVRYGEFPLKFTALHDLALKYLLPHLIRRQKADISAIQDCVDRLAGDLVAQSVAREALGEAKGHLESLEELKRQPSAS